MVLGANRSGAATWKFQTLSMFSHTIFIQISMNRFNLLFFKRRRTQVNELNLEMRVFICVQAKIALLHLFEIFVSTFLSYF